MRRWMWREKWQANLDALINATLEITLDRRVENVDIGGGRARALGRPFY